MSPNWPKSVQMGLTWSKLIQMGPNKSKWIQRGPTGSKWIQMFPNGSKWVQIRPNRLLLFPKWCKMSQTEKEVSYCLMWSNIVQFFLQNHPSRFRFRLYFTVWITYCLLTFVSESLTNPFLDPATTLPLAGNNTYITIFTRLMRLWLIYTAHSIQCTPWK